MHPSSAMRRCKALHHFIDADGYIEKRCEEPRGHERTTVHRVDIGQVTEYRWPCEPPVKLVTTPSKADMIGMRLVTLVWLAVLALVVWEGSALVVPVCGTSVLVAFELLAEHQYRRSRNGSGEAARDRERAGTNTASTASATLADGARITGGTITFTAGSDGSLSISGPGAVIGPSAPTGANIVAVPAGNWAIGSLTIKNNTFTGIPYTHEQAGEDSRLQERDGDLPLLAFKNAVLVWKIGAEFGPALISAYGHAPWGATDAICTQGVDHAHIPDEACSCGFYARRSPDNVNPIEPGDANVLVDVELYGRIIVYERGYRAQRQRLLRVAVASCWYCHGPSTVVGAHAPTPLSMRTQGNQWWEPCYPFCDTHVDLSATNLRMTVAELADVLGVPVETVHSAP